MWKMEKIYKVDGYQSNRGLGKDLAKLLSKITKKSFVSIRAIGSRGQKLGKKKLLLTRWL